LSAAFADVRPGERLWIDDGKIGCVVAESNASELLVEVVHAPPNGARLRPDKGINLPDSRLRLSSITEADLRHLDFAVEHADIIALSFVRRPADIERLFDELRRRKAERLGVVLKIETREAFENLPDLLLAGLRWPRLGVMVARGDLAVEVGFERLAEVQEEILWMCEAAHVPVIWATQVLDTLARRGQPTRAEVTDAAMSSRAECIMLNKGPKVLNAVRFLDDVLRRMVTHQEKKRSLLRELSISHVHAQVEP
jgi:pyruvate kinase